MAENQNHHDAASIDTATRSDSHVTKLYWMIHDYFQKLDGDGKLPLDDNGQPQLEPNNTYPRIDPEDYARNDDPDGIAHNYPTYHEFGNFTHSSQVLERWRELHHGTGEICAHLDGSVIDQMQQYFESQVDGIGRGELFDVAIILHDIAKNISPLYPDDPRWPLSLRKHEHHEDVGADFVRTYPPIRKLLQEEYQFTDTQLNYIADCIQHHFVLDQVRRERIEQHLSYDFNFSQSDECRKICRSVIASHPTMAMEIGVFFLADSAGKTTQLQIADTDAAYTQYLEELHQDVLDGKVEGRIEKALSQQTLNFQVGKTYLTEVCRS